MMKKILSLLGFVTCVILFSCQKEVVWNDVDLNPGDGTDTTGGTGGDTTATDGELVVKAYEITVGTNDTNIVTCQWDADKKFTAYNSTGKINGIAVDIHYIINRETDGKIRNIISKSTSLGSFTDSTVYIPTYKTGTSQLDHVTDIQYSFIGNLRDSIQYEYNASGQVISKEYFSVYFGLPAASQKETYAYDASGNVVTINNYVSDGTSYSLQATTTNTFNAHKAAITLGEEAFIILNPSDFSKNDATQIVTNAVASGTTYTNTFSSQLYNSSDRPASANITVAPKPPGYDLKVIYYYK